MAETSIEWTDKVWNPTTGCDRVSPGCDNCYALTMAARLKRMGQAKYQADGDPRTSGPGFALTIHPDEVDTPLRWRKPRRVFVNSMSDLFHEDVPPSFVADVFAVMALAGEHSFQVLTKRPERMAQVLDGPTWHECFRRNFERRLLAKAPDHWDLWPLPNVWIGTSIESNLPAILRRADHLRATPAAVRWISAEPLLGPLDDLDLTGIDWLVAGGESGRNARPMHPAWIRDLRDRCAEVGVPFFFKQWGEWAPATPDLVGRPRMVQSQLAGQESVPMFRVGKKRAGRELDGRTYDEFPEVVPVGR